MKILLGNKFFFLRGGAERSFFDTAELLMGKGHEVMFFSMDHPENLPSPYSKYFVTRVDYEQPGSFSRQVRTAGRILYSFEARRKIEQLIKEEKPDLVHLHNIHHQISPSILHVLKRYRLPTVMTLHDYKMVCPVYTMLRRDKPCENCRGGKYYHCLLQRCSRSSYLKSLLNSVEMYLHHALLHVYDSVDVFISPSQFLKGKVKEMGFKGKLFHLPNFIRPDQFVPAYSWADRTITYSGRLSRGKGLFTLLSAVKGLGVRCDIFGDGPQREALERRKEEEKLDCVSLWGYKPQQELWKRIQQSMLVVLPSEWYENNPLAILEAFALGKPVIGSKIGGIPELCRDGETGLTFEPGNVADLREKIDYFISHPQRIVEMGKKARRLVEERYDSEKYYDGLMAIYEKAMAAKNDK